jgi:hypothetical protein
MNRSASESQESATEGVLSEPPLSFFLLETLLEVGGGELEDAGFRPVREQVEGSIPCSSQLAISE